ncbi:C-terminal domain-containing protein, putative [Babesia ovata]|uniref:C-terminal domain-containing protein, putative n=1 Tax=Babesia ovata TaxID=189622 RepID=A0A2H6K998_9APIC|nr:C-terminal domain-containing protein, putative [Babesia ovata]GBE59565.1 C-terminal domain-containing protein, putative [Babesia ovata]
MSESTLQIVVKILSDLGYSKTLKRLRKEAGDEKLRPENVPHEVRAFNFKALAAGLIVKEGDVQPKPEVAPKVESTDASTPVAKPVSGKLVFVQPKTEKNPTQPEKNQGTSVVAEMPKGTPCFEFSNIVAGRFKRIQDEVWLNRIEKEELKENSYTMKNDDFSLKAAQELIQVKGKNFRTEKMKKKRASWKGSGEITSHVNSVQFDDSDGD